MFVLNYDIKSNSLYFLGKKNTRLFKYLFVITIKIIFIIDDLCAILNNILNIILLNKK